MGKLPIEQVFGVLSHDRICELCKLDEPSSATETGSGPIVGAQREQIRTAGYNLRLGQDYYLRTESKTPNTLSTAQLGDGNQTLIIPAHGVAIVSTLETLNFPSDIVGHISLKQDLVMLGLIMPSQSQIDAGYVGGIFVLLYNLSGNEVALQLGRPILRLELIRLMEPAPEYKGDYRKKTLAAALKTPIQSGLLRIRTDLDSVQRDVTKAQTIGFAVGLLVLLSTVATGYFSYFGPLREKVAALEQRIASTENLKELRKKIEDAPSREEMEGLKKQIALLTEHNQLAAPPASHPTPPKP